MKPEEVAVAIGHYKQAGAAALNLHMIRKHNPGLHPILVTDDCSPMKSLTRLAGECERYDATLRPGTRRLGHTGGDLRAFYHGLNFAKERGCRYLMKLSQRAIFDIPNWLTDSAKLLNKLGFPAAGNRAGITPGFTIAHIRTSAIMLEVERWADPEILNQLEPRPLRGMACEWIIAKMLQRIGGVYLTLPFINGIIVENAPGEIWHDAPGSEARYRELAEREGIDLGDDFNPHGSNVLPDGRADPDYR